MKTAEKRPLQTLHSHTRNSDGVLTHRQVLDVCAQNQIGVVAFTDHDTLPDKKQIGELRSFRDHPVKYVWGIEITSGYPREIMSKDPHMFHLVGLFLDPGHRTLAEFCAEMRSRRLGRLKQKIKKFTQLGFKVTFDAVLATVSPHGTPTSLNLVNVLISDPDNKAVIEKYVKKMEELSRQDEEVKQLYREMVIDDRGDKQKYFNTFLKDGSPFKIELPEQKLPEMDAVVSLIRRAEGLAVLAHWSFEREEVGRPLLEKICREKRIDGLETVYDLFLLDNPFWREKFKTDRTFLRKLTRKYDLFESGGVDAHKPEDFRLFAQKKEYNRETVGLVEKITRRHRVNLAHSSL